MKCTYLHSVSMVNYLLYSIQIALVMGYDPVYSVEEYYQLAAHFANTKKININNVDKCFWIGHKWLIALNLLHHLLMWCTWRQEYLWMWPLLWNHVLQCEHFTKWVKWKFKIIIHIQSLKRKPFPKQLTYLFALFVSCEFHLRWVLSSNAKRVVAFHFLALPNVYLIIEFDP